MSRKSKKQPKDADPREMHGVLHYHAEQGLSPFRAFQDERHIKPANPETGEPEQWSYEGMHKLKNGDRLTVYSNDGRRKVLWSGKLRMRDLRNDRPRSERVDFPYGVDPAKWWLWFRDEHPASLIPSRPRTPR